MSQPQDMIKQKQKQQVTGETEVAMASLWRLGEKDPESVRFSHFAGIPFMEILPKKPYSFHLRFSLEPIRQSFLGENVLPVEKQHP